MSIPAPSIAKTSLVPDSTVMGSEPLTCTMCVAIAEEHTPRISSSATANPAKLDL